MKILRSLFSIVLLTGSSLTLANPWYVHGGIGASHSDSNYKKLISAVNNANNDQPYNNDHLWSFSGKLGFGHQFCPYGSLETSVYWLGKDKHTHSGTDRINSTVRHSSHAEYKGYGLALDAVGSIPVTSKISFFGKAGLMLVRIKGENNASQAEYSFTESKTRLAPKIGIGMEYRFTENSSFRFEYERLINAAKKSKRGETIVMPDIDYDLLFVGFKTAF